MTKHSELSRRAFILPVVGSGFDWLLKSEPTEKKTCCFPQSICPGIRDIKPFKIQHRFGSTLIPEMDCRLRTPPLSCTGLSITTGSRLTTCLIWRLYTLASSHYTRAWSPKSISLTE